MLFTMALRDSPMAEYYITIKHRIPFVGAAVTFVTLSRGIHKCSILYQTVMVIKYSCIMSDTFFLFSSNSRSTDDV